MIVWEFPYSGWHLFLLEMDALLHAVNLGSGQIGFVLTFVIVDVFTVLYRY